MGAKKRYAKGLSISISSGRPTPKDPLPEAAGELNDLPKPTPIIIIHPLFNGDWETNIVILKNIS